MSMLSVENCREFIPNSEKFTDEQIEALRSKLYSLADLVLEDYLSGKNSE